ncbi:MAG: hypothetical protein H7Y18_04730 [Clostridiaceae bacterium]|nr:hypothetical protein [Clostridiaceae bacterium]
MKIDEDRNITVDLTKDRVSSLNAGISITTENGVKIILPFDKIKKESSEKIDNDFQ